MKLVDSSCWVHCLRSRGDRQIVTRVRSLVTSGEAAWCAMVRLELWAGAGSENDRRVLREFEQTMPELPISEEVWEEACELADRCRRAGKTAPAHDVLIAACARHHGVELEHADSHFEFLMKL
ncbi:MAG: PIN domain-containing protein [Verrucomicrobiae bacterium]|nr:PIN domain-containing protein [Verrucomicrobiae bacterium]